MRLVSNLKLAGMALALGGVLTACSSDDDGVKNANEGQLTIKSTANYSGETARNANGVVLNSFMVNFKEIELEYAEGDSNGSDLYFDSEDEVELRGPFEVDLLAQNSVSLTTVNVPNGVYEEVEFEFDKSEDNNSALFGKSMQLEGSINGTPFVFWHDFDEEIEVDYEDQGTNLVIDGNSSELVINFDLDAVVGINGLVDLSIATDLDGDGTITISPQDQDGNQALAAALKSAIEAQIELMDDMYDDDED
ncbi:DUF4382 domain-containing protein [Mesonia sp. HuA40]|uniref:DUF4382 domain-containing protein n=1 Tax=Mesonia sp. HuA40 TaxID=2602761 RepID=UPI0011CBA21B|nr:DUF4382 domain-containing protein [Mesonia sp. HuA40]TXK74500.1 DUF4382 domain-containing protein [Mesonia sp. HuA40]